MSVVVVRRGLARTRVRPLLGGLVGFALLLAMLTAGTTASAATAISAGDGTVACPAGAVVVVDAHPDDDLFFQNPDVLTSVRAGACVRTVYVTAGDGGEQAGAWYYQSRRAGLHSAYAQMAGTSNSWTTTSQEFAGHLVEVDTLTAAPRISLAFLQLPDGNLAGQGFPAYGYQSLQQLFQGTTRSLTTVEGTDSYTRDGLVATIGALITSQGASTVRTLDFEGSYGDGDHSDHHTVGYLTRAAQQQFAPSASLVGYRGYPVSAEPANVAGDDLSAKWAAYQAYAAWDWKECRDEAACSAPGHAEVSWMQRQYTVTPTVVTPVPVGTVNVAATAAVSASSQNAGTGQLATKAVDGVVDGYPGTYTAEWATQGGGTGSWIQLDWTQPTTVDRVVLFDRPNTADQVTGATLDFSDGTSVPVGSLADDGTATTVSFTARATTSLRLTVTGVGSATSNVGLSELQVWTPAATTTPTPAPTPTATAAAQIAAAASVTASSENSGTGQLAAKAVDGVVDGYPGDHTAEWASAGQGAGAWIQLTWAAPVTIDRVVLHDRPNSGDRITGAALTFSDGSSAPVGALADDGSATDVTFTARTVTSLRLDVTAVSSTTLNAGLAELEVWTPAAGDDLTPTPTSTPAPTPTPTPTPTPVDRAGAAVVTASNENTATGQLAARAVDGIVDGYPGVATAEWATAGGGVGTWIQLTWAQPVSLDRVVLFDRPNTDDRITAARLVFDDGSTEAVGALEDSGSGSTVSFVTRTTTTVRLEVTGVSASTRNVGLAELQAWSD